MVTNRKNERLIYLVFTMPATIAFFLVVIMPFAIGIGYSFVDWDGIVLNPMTFVGLDNYKRIFTDERFIASALHTLIFTLMAVVTINVTGLALALLVTSKLKGSNMARTMFFMPNLIGGLILGYIWKFILSDTFRSIGEATGWTGVFFNWLLDPHFALFSLVVVMTWQMAGYVMIIYITGLQSVPDDLIEAAKNANIYDFIMTLPEGFDTPTGERGVRLSGGQKQRISIARVFLKNPSILIFDEATSALDNQSEALVQESMERLCRDRTTIIIARLRGGKLVEHGTHQELLALDGYYKTLYTMHTF